MWDILCNWWDKYEKLNGQHPKMVQRDSVNNIQRHRCSPPRPPTTTSIQKHIYKKWKTFSDKFHLGRLEERIYVTFVFKWGSFEPRYLKLIRCFLCGSFLWFVFRVFLWHTVLSVHCSLVDTCWDRADLLALCIVFLEFLSLSLMVSCVRCGTWLYRFLSFAFFLTWLVYLWA